ncbi:acylneuraminate cytidylyltransferase family protein [Ureibacillus chungkukjangi]|uniref:acylneuraminate cytidylyltransferase family protein n=1 Tax=Ureibacillus chungkukjangi TaxID=1202712 RepID=UPI002041C709|nr:acylneuraminate cytidylyltransferase family protein [Ureibacillus chungkukjangi]MCM3389084.1 acylneuraminate cytidylyltransferase family protein [Ureibacillus chungkukjangi]
MYLNKKILAIIPARGGSKEIKNKNIIKVAGKPLIQYTIDEAKKSKYIDKILLSTDSIKIAQIGEELGLIIDHLRPKELALDTSPTIDAVKYSLNIFKDENFDYVILLQPTQPLRTVRHIDESIEKIIPGNIESIISVSEINEHPIFMRTINKFGELDSLLNINSTIRRQDLPNYYKVNGAIYINKVTDILNDYVSFNDNKYPYIMDKQYDLDIDTVDDLNRFELLMLEGSQ